MSVEEAADRTVTRWVVGVDGSDDAAAALRWAGMMQREAGGAITPVVAWDVPLPTFAVAGRRAIDIDREGIEAAGTAAAATSIEAARRDDQRTFDVDDMISVEGHPSEVLLGRAGFDRALVVGRRGIGHLRHRLLGSVSRDLAIHAGGPVVIVPATWDGGTCRTIVVGFDGSDHARAALEWAVENAPADATVRALIAIEMVPWLRPELVIDRHADEVAEVERRLRAATDEIDPDGRAEREVVLHGPRQALTEAMDDADLIVVGPRGAGAVRRAVLGSVTTWLLEDARCPIAVVPH